MHELKADALLMKEHLLRGNIRKMAEVLGHSWQAKKQLSDRIATSSIDEIYNLAIEAGAYAGKISGAGGGGFMMFMVDPDRRPVVCRALAATPGRIQIAHLSSQGAMAWRCLGCDRTSA
jgi:D-glycero-alpha-D-manno-heptose-7-phosphate kinase